MAAHMKVLVCDFYERRVRALRAVLRDVGYGLDATI
jgi:hypothetical protein